MVAAAAATPCHRCFVPSVDEPPTQPRKQECIHVFTFILLSPCACCWCWCWLTGWLLNHSKMYAMLARLPNEVIWELMPNEHRDYHLEQKWRIWTAAHKSRACRFSSLFFSLSFCECVTFVCDSTVRLTCCVDTKSPIFDGVLCCVLFFRMPQRRLNSHCKS